MGTREDIASELSRRGVRVTQQRLEVLRLLRTLDHPTAAQLHRALCRKLPSVSKKTVYSVLDAFVRAGLAAIVTDGGEPYRYEGNTDPHYHAHCRICGALVDMPAVADGQIRGRSPIPEGFQVELLQVTIVGRCRRCAENG